MQNKNNFTKEVENLISPIEVGSIHFIQGLYRFLPKKVQNKFTEKSGEKNPYMGFVVEPYSYFLCYEIIDLEKARKIIPDGFKLIKTKIFEDDEPGYYAILGCFRAHTSAFWGSRIEFYIIAENEATGLLSWLIIDYDTDTISHDKKNGLRKPNASKCVVTTNHRGRLYVDVKRNDNSKILVFDSDIKTGLMKKLDQRLWLEGNLSITYGKTLEGSQEDIFSLKFEPCEVDKALRIPLDSLNLESNNWYNDIIADEPRQIVCFPYAQHFISDSPGFSSKLKDKKELLKSIEEIKFEDVKPYSASSLKYLFALLIVSVIVESFIIFFLIVFFIL